MERYTKEKYKQARQNLSQYKELEKWWNRVRLLPPLERTKAIIKYFSPYRGIEITRENIKEVAEAAKKEAIIARLETFLVEEECKIAREKCKEYREKIKQAADLLTRRKSRDTDYSIKIFSIALGEA